MTELAKSFDPAPIEAQYGPLWEQRGLYEPEWIVRRVRWMEGHESHACPPQRMTRLNDSELRDIVTFLAGPGSGDRIFTRTR